MIARMPDNREIYYHTMGSGPGLLLVHGGLPDHFEPLVDVLSPRYRCIACDRLGFRRSIHPGRNSTVEEQVAAIEAVHRSVTSAPVWVFGFSSGGIFALAYALSRPDRVKGLLLVEPALYAIYPPEDTPPAVERLQNLALPLFQQGQVEQGWYAFLDAVFSGPNLAAERIPLSDEFLDLARSCGFDLEKALTWCPSEAQLQQLTQPVLILEGDQSPALLRDISHRLNSQLLHSKLVTLVGQDHSMPNSAPNLVAEQVEAFILDGGA